MLLESIPSIENNFWSTDKTALNILLEKLNHSQKTTIAIQDYFKQRARIEEEYGNQLLKLSEAFNDNIQQHDEEENFNIVSNTTEMSARAHMDLSQNIQNLIESPLNEFLNDQENIKSFMTNQMKESQNLKMLHGDNVRKTREMYINECQKINPSFKEIDLLDFEYQKAINLMQANSHSWIHDWRESCKTFQSLELNRLEYLKAVIKTFSSMTACTCSIDDQTSERLSNVMDDINGNTEISKFISNHGTGSTLPEIPKYTKYKRGGTEGGDDYSSYRTSSEVMSETRTIKEINIPIKHDEELRSVNDQLKKIPSPWDNTSSDKPKLQMLSSKSHQTSYPPPQQHLQYPLNPVYKSSRRNPSQSDSRLDNFTFNQDDIKVASYNKKKATLVTPYEEKKYHQPPSHHYFPWNNNNNTTTKQQQQLTATTSATTINKKSSILFAPLGFLKKKKTVAATNSFTAATPAVDNKKKRMSLSHLSISKNNNTAMMLPNSSSTVLTPPSPMFSQMDFYYSPTPSSEQNEDLQQQPSPHLPQQCM